MLPLVVGSNVGHSLHDLSRIEETNKTFFLFSLLMTSPRDHKDQDLLLVDAQLRCAHEDQLCLGAQGPYVAAGYHDDDYHYTLPCVGGPTDRQAAAQPRLRLTAAAGRAATLQCEWSGLAPDATGVVYDIHAKNAQDEKRAKEIMYPKAQGAKAKPVRVGKKRRAAA